MWYKLEGREPVPCSVEETFRDEASRIVAQDRVDGVLVSTVFLHLDHSMGEGRPVLFETMVFAGDNYTERYCTYDEAAAGHARILAAVRAVLEQEKKR